MIKLANVTARGVVGHNRVALIDVTLEQRAGVLAILGAPSDGTSLLLDVLAGVRRVRAGRVVVLGADPGQTRARVAYVSKDAPLPETLRVDEVCDLASDLRGEPRRTPSDRLGTLGIEMLARRSVRSLRKGERRAVALALALTSLAEVLLLDEPLLEIEPTAARLVEPALRTRSRTATVIMTTASPRDATRLADGVGVLTAGRYEALPADPAVTGIRADYDARRILGASASIRVVVAPSHGKNGAFALVGALGGSEAVSRVETAAYAGRSGGVAIVVSGPDLGELEQAVTRAIAASRVDVEAIEPVALPLEAIRAALAARAMSPPPGSTLLTGEPS